MEKIEQIITALVDPKLMENYNKEEIKRMIFCAMACINKNSKYRPRMQKIVGVLKGTITPPRKILDWEDNKSLYRNNNGNFLRPTVKKLSIISKIDDEDIVGIRLYVFTYKKLENATDCFSKNKLLSKGRFGEVYIGYIDFTIVTIKKFSSIDISGKQEDVFEEIKDIGSSVQHRNLVNLIGYCDDGFNKLLVYEFVHKESSLRCHLHGNGRSNLDWPTRLHIALSIARGLIKLQDTLWKIYEDYNDDCIFLGDNFEPKFAEYGHIHFFSKSATSSSTSSWPSIHDADHTYFFGLVLLELITGKQPVHDIINWAMPLLASSLRNGEGKNSFVDDKLKDYDNEEMHRMIACALACLRKMPPYPPQMNEVIEVLKGHRSLETLDALGEVYSWTAIFSSFAIQG
ncbi:proline-rich receptor-like protein kinase PERK3 [Manihot esculenta]|uniref:proline-rich receptor-like protein kinase PERK3 n=1 Tax=Manihot esculenta TaxID=3983 RepID=UPI001CC5C969|nr:proline-rich receptor-like protein kinase PERK3 [Manihot esculenta]